MAQVCAALGADGFDPAQDLFAILMIQAPNQREFYRPLFRDMVCYQEEVRDASRVAEVLNRVIMNAKRLSAPAQINMPRDFWTQVIDIDLPAVVGFELPSGGDDAIAAAAEDLAKAAAEFMTPLPVKTDSIPILNARRDRFVAALTAYRALIDLADLQPGQRLLIHAATGGVGALFIGFGLKLAGGGLA